MNEPQASQTKASRFIPVCGSSCAKTIAVVSSFVAIAALVDDPSDVLLWSGSIAVSLAFWFAQYIPERLRFTLRRLFESGILRRANERVYADEVEALIAEFENSSKSWSRVAGPLLALVVFVLYKIDYLEWDNNFTVAFTFYSVLVAYAAGSLLGLVAFNSRIVKLLTARNIRVVPVPGFPDHVAGLRPVGDFYLFQALIVAIPAIHLSVWWFLIRFAPASFSYLPSDYGSWEQVYSWLLIVVVVLEVLSFSLPVWQFHGILRKSKLEFQHALDEDFSELAEKYSLNFMPEDSSEYESLQIDMQNFRSKFEEVENMPTWPLAKITRRFFEVNGLLVLPPALIELVGNTRDYWSLLIDFVSGQGI